MISPTTLQVAKIEEIDDDNDSDDAAEGQEGEGLGGAGKNQSRAEKKARKALAKLGLKPVSNITRVVIRRPKNVRCNHPQATVANTE